MVATIDVKGIEPLKPYIDDFDNDFSKFCNEQPENREELLVKEEGVLQLFLQDGIHLKLKTLTGEDMATIGVADSDSILAQLMTNDYNTVERSSFYSKSIDVFVG